jgi:hypothetical protein
LVRLFRCLLWLYYGFQDPYGVLIISINAIGTELSTLRFQLCIEAKDILNSGWWNTSDAIYNITNWCNWGQIFCNKAGNITEINVDHHLQVVWGSKFATLNLSTFHNLESLGVSSISLWRESKSLYFTLLVILFFGYKILFIVLLNEMWTN